MRRRLPAALAASAAQRTVQHTQKRCANAAAVPARALSAHGGQRASHLVDGRAAYKW
jgi:hypothetical protein